MSGLSTPTSSRGNTPMNTAFIAGTPQHGGHLSPILANPLSPFGFDDDATPGSPARCAEPLGGAAAAQAAGPLSGPSPMEGVEEAEGPAAAATRAGRKQPPPILLPEGAQVALPAWARDLGA